MIIFAKNGRETTAILTDKQGTVVATYIRTSRGWGEQTMDIRLYGVKNLAEAVERAKTETQTLEDWTIAEVEQSYKEKAQRDKEYKRQMMRIAQQVALTNRLWKKYREEFIKKAPAIVAEMHNVSVECDGIAGMVEGEVKVLDMQAEKKNPKGAYTSYRNTSIFERFLRAKKATKETRGRVEEERYRTVSRLAGGMPIFMPDIREMVADHDDTRVITVNL